MQIFVEMKTQTAEFYSIMHKIIKKNSANIKSTCCSV